jgi:glycosyltransferase involved in cell wall biosynthesis
MPQVAVVIPARNEADRIGATVKAARTIPDVDTVIVVDDGSTDETGPAADEAGATVIRHARNRGKAAAMETGAAAVRRLDAEDAARAGGAAPARATADGTTAANTTVARATADGTTASRATADSAKADSASAGRPPRLLLFLDADLGDTAADAGPLIAPVAAGEADMTIAAFSSRVKLGGHGFVVRLAGNGIRRATGWAPSQPLNGQRCLTRKAFEAARPLSYGFGVETAMTIDLVRRGLRITEVEVPLAHRATGSDLRSQLHRARQFADVGWALSWRR